MSMLSTEPIRRARESIPVRYRVAVRERIARAIGLPWDELARRDVDIAGMADLDEGARRIIEQVRPYTLTPEDRVAALVGAVDYVVDRRVEGAIVEAGLWKGGSLMATALRLLGRGAADRELVGFDTFTGMTPPTAEDVDYRGVAQAPQGEGAQLPLGMGYDDVRARLLDTGYPPELIRLVAGDVLETIPREAPTEIALLRLDTDWYESTRHELEHLYPRLAVGGVLLIDDYGHYQGARKATDEYLADQRIFLQRIDYTARIAVKQAA
jgi:O-methyltransferase